MVRFKPPLASGDGGGLGAPGQQTTPLSTRMRFELPGARWDGCFSMKSRGLLTHASRAVTAPRSPPAAACGCALRVLDSTGPSIG